MEQLSGTDSYFLYTERGNVYNHVAALGIYDPSTAPGRKVRFKDILQYFARRLDRHKVFRRRLSPCRTASIAPTGSTIPTSISSSTSATSRCRIPATGGS